MCETNRGNLIKYDKKFLNPATKSPDFFQASLFQLLKLEIHCEDHISPS